MPISEDGGGIGEAVLRKAAAVVGGAGAALGALLYLGAVVLWVAVLALSGFLWPPTLVELALFGTLAAGLVLAVAGAWGAWLALRAGTRRGALLMLLSAVGIVAVFAAQPFLVNAAGSYGVPERLRADPGLPPGDYFLTAVAPAAPLLVGAALAFLAPQRGVRPGAAGRG